MDPFTIKKFIDEIISNPNTKSVSPPHSALLYLFVVSQSHHMLNLQALNAS